MTTFLIPILLVICAVVLIILLGYNESQLRREEDEPPVLSEFESHQLRVRAARQRAEFRSQQRSIDNEREKL